MDLQLDDSQLVLHDVLAFIDECEPPAGKTKKSRAKAAPDYERKRRERKRAEREALRRQAAQLEAQLELLRLRKPSQSGQTAETKWRWLDVAMDEEERRYEAEQINRQLRGCLREQLQASETFKALVMQSTLATRIQTVLGPARNMQVMETPPTVFVDHDAISAHLNGMLHRLYPSADSVFQMTHIFGTDIATDLESLATSARIKQQDPTFGPCIETMSTTPLGCSFKDTVTMLWEMLLAREVFGPDRRYTMKNKQLTQQSAEMAYSMDFGTSEGMLDGVTLMRRFEEDNRAMLLWTSLLVHPNGRPCFRSQGWVAITRLPSNPEVESSVRMCSRIAGSPFGMEPGASSLDMPKARKFQPFAKARVDVVQQKILDRAEQKTNQSDAMQ